MKSHLCCIKYYKRIFCVLMVFTITFMLSACGKKDKISDGKDDDVGFWVTTKNS